MAPLSVRARYDVVIDDLADRHPVDTKPLAIAKVGLHERAGLGLARAGSIGGHTSGELFICFATGNKLTAHGGTGPALSVRMLDDDNIDPLFMATIESTEEAVINALVAAETMTGRDDHTAHALPHDLLMDAMARHGRGPQPAA